MVDGLPDVAAVEEPVARRRKDLYRNVGRMWTQSELRFLRRHRHTMSVRQIAKRLDRSPKGVTNMLSKLRQRKVRVAEMVRRCPVVGLPDKRWTDEEIAALLASVGVGKSPAVMISHRGFEACRRKLRRLQEGGVVEQDGMLSARQVAQLYRCPISRVWRFIDVGVLHAHKGAGGRWRIDPSEAERVGAELSAPKRTWMGSPPDMGDYRERYGMRRATG